VCKIPEFPTGAFGVVSAADDRAVKCAVHFSCVESGCLGDVSIIQSKTCSLMSLISVSELRRTWSWSLNSGGQTRSSRVLMSESVLVFS